MQQMATLAGIEACLSPPGHYKMGLVWEKQWKRTEVGAKAAMFAMAQRVGRNFTVVQQAGLLFRCGTMGRA